MFLVDTNVWIERLLDLHSVGKRQIVTSLVKDKETHTMMELFDLNSIALNKQGKKSEEQVKLIKEAVNPGIWLYGGLGVLLLGGCSYAGLASMGGSSAMSFLGLLLAAVGLFASLRGFTTWNLRRKLLTEPVQSAEGTVIFKMQGVVGQLIEADHFVAETSDGRGLHPIGLAGVNPRLPPGNYCFYFLKTRSWMLASEPLSSEAELRNNMNDLLAKVMGYDLATLEDCRQSAREGKLKVAEGLPKFDVVENAIIPDEIATPKIYCTVGDFKFQIPNRSRDAIIGSIPYRAYYREVEAGRLLALEIV